VTGSARSREKRLAERIRSDVSELLVRGEIRDPAAQGLIVSAVDVTRDLGVARIWVRSLHDVDDAKRKLMLAAITRAGGAVRSALAQTLDVRRVPELRFAWDESVEKTARLDELLYEIESERGKKS
jgi:ribosome-binding factor A